MIKYNTEYSIEDFLQERLKVYKERAKSKNRSFKLSFKQFKKLCLSKCTYCGAPPEDGYEHSYKNLRFRINGIDRLDNNKGYVKTNCLACCTYCNYAKKDMDMALWLRWCHQVANNTKDLLIYLPKFAENENLERSKHQKRRALQETNSLRFKTLMKLGV